MCGWRSRHVSLLHTAGEPPPQVKKIVNSNRGDKKDKKDKKEKDIPEDVLYCAWRNGCMQWRNWCLQR